MNKGLRAAAAGAAGGGVAFGIAELVHGLFQLVPSIPVVVSQRIIELTPGGLATEAIGTLGKAASPVLVAVVVLVTLGFCALLATLSRRSPLPALGGVVLLAAIALLAAFTEPFIAPVITVLTVVGALAAGTAVARYLLRSSGIGVPESRAEEPDEDAGPQQPMEGVRSREAHSSGGLAVNRRNFLAMTGAAAVASVAAAGAGRALSGDGGAQVTSAPSTPTPDKVPSVATKLPPPPPGASIDVPGMPPLITPSDEFYLIDTAISSPRINRDRWTLKVTGAVDNPIELSYNDLVSMPTIEADITMSCVSNEVGGGLISHGRWTGIRLQDVLKEAGVSPDKLGRSSAQLVGRSVDGWTSGFRTELAFDRPEALVAFGLNDGDLPRKHGYPARLVIPGLYGYVSATKWLQEIELTDWGFDAYWIKRGWSKEGPIKTQSRIDTVTDGENLSAGKVRVGGVAWAPTRGIERVEVSTDDGKTWNDADLAVQLDIDAWRQYVYDWDASPGDHVVKVRAIDGTGETQTAEQAPPIPSGATGYHTVRVTVE